MSRPEQIAKILEKDIYLTGPEIYKRLGCRRYPLIYEVKKGRIHCRIVEGTYYYFLPENKGKLPSWMAEGKLAVGLSKQVSSDIKNPVSLEQRWQELNLSELDSLEIRNTIDQDQLTPEWQAPEIKNEQQRTRYWTDDTYRERQKARSRITNHQRDTERREVFRIVLQNIGKYLHDT